MRRRVLGLYWLNCKKCFFIVFYLTSGTWLSLNATFAEIFFVLIIQPSGKPNFLSYHIFSLTTHGDRCRHMDGCLCGTQDYMDSICSKAGAKCPEEALCSSKPYFYILINRPGQIQKVKPWRNEMNQSVWGGFFWAWRVEVARFTEGDSNGSSHLQKAKFWRD